MRRVLGSRADEAQSLQRLGVHPSIVCAWGIWDILSKYPPPSTTKPNNPKMAKTTAFAVDETLLAGGEALRSQTGPRMIPMRMGRPIQGLHDGTIALRDERMTIHKRQPK
ncbi:MAG: hypothetical protein WCU88_05050 [Elusimicrobiota bacterium]|jgi:hypothetical protein